VRRLLPTNAAISTAAAPPMKVMSLESYQGTCGQARERWRSSVGTEVECRLPEGRCRSYGTDRPRAGAPVENPRVAW
jgi:hypothetical protein